MERRKGFIEEEYVRGSFLVTSVITETEPTKETNTRFKMSNDF